MKVTIRVADTEKDIAACMALRWTVFVEEQGVPEADELDGSDVGCTHLMAFDDVRLVGAARYKVTDNTAKIGRVCVDAECRGRGVGAALISFARQTSGVPHAVLGAQVAALPFYQRLGFSPFGDTYIDAGIPHQDMEAWQ